MLHTHDANFEVLYRLSGLGKVFYEDKEESMQPGCCNCCPQGCSHSLVNDGTEMHSVFALAAKRVDPPASV